MEQYRCFGCMQLISEPVCPHCGHPAGGVNFPHQLPVGTVLAERYLIGRAVNQTEDTLVYIALDQSRDKTVLVREYFPGRAARREGAEVVSTDSVSFSAGLDTQSRLNELLMGSEELTQVCGGVEAFRENGTVYFAADQIRGPSLGHYVKRRGGVIGAEEALRILRSVIGAAAVLHQAGLAHGSISLDRIVLDPMGGARLLGFGETSGAEASQDVFDLCRVICGCLVEGGDQRSVPAAELPGLTDQQKMALEMGLQPNPQERFSSAVALRRALLGEVTPPAAVAAAPAAPAEEAAPAMPKTEAIVSPVIPAAEPEPEPEMPKTEAIVSPVIPAAEPEPEPEMPKTEAIVSPVIPAAEPEPEPEMPKTEAILSGVISAAPAEPVVPEKPDIPPVEIPKASSMPPTEIVSEFKIQRPEVQQEPAAPVTPDQGGSVPYAAPAFEQNAYDPMPRTEQAPPAGNAPGWEPQPQWPQEPQPQWSQEPQWQAPPKKKKSGLAVGVIVGVVVALIAALVVCFLFVHIWRDATCEAPKTCIFCGKTEGSVLDHKWLDPTCEEPSTCKYCGDTQGKALGHEWNPATCQAPKTCATCGATEGEPMSHSWLNATCESPKTCLICGTTEGDVGGHTWADATCESPKTCTTCGETSGSALGHSWKDATYTEPKTCTRCGATEGSPKGYLEYVSGDFQNFKWGSSSTHCYQFDKAVNNCKGFTLYFKPTFNYNAWVDDWKLLYQDTDGTWHEYGGFTLNTSTYEHVFEFSPTLDIKAVAVVPRISGTYSYSFSLGVWDVYYTN